MLDISLEYRRGILFVRLIGSFDKKNQHIFKTRVLNMIEENGIKNIVLNFKYLDNIDFKGISLIYYLYEHCRNGQIYICNIGDNINQKLRKNRVFNYIGRISSEFEAFNLMKV